jgi:hypothetical protein
LYVTKWSCQVMTFSSLKSNMKMRGKKKLGNAWTDLQEDGLNIFLHWPCCQYKQMRMKLMWDAAQRLLEMCKLPYGAMRMSRGKWSTCPYYGFSKRKPPKITPPLHPVL